MAAERRREAEEADITANRAVELARIAMEEETQNRDIEKKKRLELSLQDQKIAVSEKSKDESRAAADADEARAQAVTKEEEVVTVRETARAEREKRIVVIKAKESAEREAIGITVEAEARKAAANDEADAIRVTADAEASAIKVKAEAEGARQLSEAKNLLSAEQISFAEKMEMIGKLPYIMEQAMKPAEKIDSIKIFDINGAPGFSNGNSGGGNNDNSGNLSDQLVNAMLKHRANIPLLDSILKEVGLENMDPRSIIDGKLFDNNGAAKEREDADQAASHSTGPATALHKEKKGNGSDNKDGVIAE